MKNFVKFVILAFLPYLLLNLFTSKKNWLKKFVLFFVGPCGLVLSNSKVDKVTPLFFIKTINKGCRVAS